MMKRSGRGRWTALFVMILIILTICLAGALAETSGTCGEGMTWTMDDTGKLTITGTGVIGNGQWDNSEVREVVIGDGATAIESYVFSGCENLRSIRIPEGVTKIGSCAFAFCRSLTRIKLPDSLTYIDDGALEYTGLKDLRLPENVETLGIDLVSGCRDLKYIEIRGRDVALEGAFSAEIPFDFGNTSTVQQAYICAPAGSATLARLKEQGTRCAAICEEITLNNSLSRDSGNPTRIAAKDATIDLSNRQGIVFQKAVGYYTRAELPRNQGMHGRYMEDLQVTENQLEVPGDQRFFDTEAFVLFYMKDGETFVTHPFYTVYGLAELKEPAVTSPTFPQGVDERRLVPPENLEITWVSSEGAEYEVTLFSGSAGGLVLVSAWTSERLKDNTCIIPASELLPGDYDYKISVAAISPETGEELSADTNDFRVFAGDALAGKPRMLSPFRDRHMSDYDRVFVTSLTGDLEVEWTSVPNAAYYVVELNNYRSYGTYSTSFEEQTEDTKLTIPEWRYSRICADEGACFFSLDVIAVDRYGNKERDSVCFCAGDPAALKVKADGQAVSFSGDVWTVLSPGTHTLTWEAVDGADYCVVRLVEMNGVRDMIALLSEENNSVTVELEEKTQYILTLNASTDCKVLNGGWYYMTTGRSDRESPEILEPTVKFLPKMDFTVSWTDTGAASYTVRLGKFLETDAPVEFSLVDGTLEPYYSQTAYEREELTVTKTVIPAEALDYSGMYRLLVTAVYEDGTECRAETKFHTEGDPAGCPEIEGAVVSNDPMQPGINRMPEEIRIKWTARAETEQYEAGLFITDDAGEQQELVTTLTSEEPVITLPGTILKGMTYYQLTAKEYGRDGFSREYRLWFKTLGCEEHQSVMDPAKAPTCTENGWTEGSHCAVCGAVLKEQEEIKALGHTGEWVLLDREMIGNILHSWYERECTKCHETEIREEAAEFTRLPGDANEDGEVDGRDAVHLMRWLAEDEEIELNEVNADVNQDSFVDTLDLLLLVRYLAGMDVELR